MTVKQWEAYHWFGNQRCSIIHIRIKIVHSFRIFKLNFVNICAKSWKNEIRTPILGIDSPNIYVPMFNHSIGSNITNIWNCSSIFWNSIPLWYLTKAWSHSQSNLWKILIWFLFSFPIAVKKSIHSSNMKNRQNSGIVNTYIMFLIPPCVFY